MRDYQKRIEKVMMQRCPNRKNSKDKGNPWDIIDKRQTEYCYEFAYSVPNGYSVKDLRQETDALYAACGAVVEIEDRAGVVIVRIFPKDFPNLIEYEPYMLDLAISKHKAVLGFDRIMKPIIHDFKVLHIMIAGTSGYGKTDLLRWILFQLIHKHTPEEIEIDIIDMKGFSFLPFKNIPHIGRIVRDLSGALQILKDGFHLMNQRADEVWNSGDRSTANKYKWKLILIDEASQIAPRIKQTKIEKELAAQCDQYASAISCIGREAKVGLFYCTQRPDSMIINPQVKANMDASICFKVKTASNSVIVLDKEGAERLPHKKAGRAIYSSDEDVIMQVPYIGGDDEWLKLLEPYKTEVVRNDNNDKKGTQAESDTTNDVDDTDSIELSDSDIFYGSWQPEQESKRDVETIREREIDTWTFPKPRFIENMETHEKGQRVHQNKNEADTIQLNESKSHISGRRSMVTFISNRQTTKLQIRAKESL